VTLCRHKQREGCKYLQVAGSPPLARGHRPCRRRQLPGPQDPRHYSADTALGSQRAFARDHAGIERLIAQVHKKDYALNQGHLMPGISAAAFPSIDRTTTRVAALAMMGRHERVNPGAEMIAYLRKAATTLDDDADVSRLLAGGSDDRVRGAGDFPGRWQELPTSRHFADPAV